MARKRHQSQQIIRKLRHDVRCRCRADDVLDVLAELFLEHHLPTTSAAITGLSLPLRSLGSGFATWGRRRCSSSPARRGRMATTRPSRESSGTNHSTGGSSTPSGGAGHRRTLEDRVQHNSAAQLTGLPATRPGGRAATRTEPSGGPSLNVVEPRGQVTRLLCQRERSGATVALIAAILVVENGLGSLNGVLGASLEYFRCGIRLGSGEHLPVHNVSPPTKHPGRS